MRVLSLDTCFPISPWGSHVEQLCVSFWRDSARVAANTPPGPSLTSVSSHRCVLWAVCGVSLCLGEYGAEFKELSSLQPAANAERGGVAIWSCWLMYALLIPVIAWRVLCSHYCGLDFSPEVRVTFQRKTMRRPYPFGWLIKQWNRRPVALTDY